MTAAAALFTFITVSVVLVITMSGALYPTADTAPLSEEAAYGNAITSTIQHELAVSGRAHADYDSDDRLESDDVVLPLTESSGAPANARAAVVVVNIANCTGRIGVGAAVATAADHLTVKLTRI